MQYILFWYSTWFILEINQCIPHDWNGLRSLFLLPATCNFWVDFYCRSPILQGTKDLWHDGSASAPRRYSDFSSGETTFWALKYFLSQQDHMFFLPSTLLFFCKVFKELHIRLKGGCLFFLWVRQGTTKRDSGWCSTRFRMVRTLGHTPAPT